MSSLHFSGAVVWFGQTVALLKEAQDIMIGDGLVWKVTYEKKCTVIKYNIIKLQPFPKKI